MSVGAGGFTPNEDQRRWLDSLTERERTRALEMLTNLWSSMRKVGETTDRVADLLLQGARGDVALDMVMSLALKAEGFRSLGRGEHDNAQELFASADRYRPAVMPEIVIAPDDRP